MKMAILAIGVCFVLFQISTCSEIALTAPKKDFSRRRYTWNNVPMLGTSPFGIRNIAAAVQPILNATDEEGAKKFKEILNSDTLSRGERMIKLKEWAQKQGGKTLEVFNEEIKKWTKQKIEWNLKLAKRMETLSLPARDVVLRRIEIDNDETINEFQSALEIDALMGKTNRDVYNEVYNWYKHLTSSRKKRVESDDLIKICTVLLRLSKNPLAREQQNASLNEAKVVPVNERALLALKEIAEDDNLTLDEMKEKITAWIVKQQRARGPSVYPIQ